MTKPKPKPKLFTWKPVPLSLATTTAGVLMKARVHGMTALKRSPQAVAVKLPRPSGQPPYWQDFVVINGALWTRPALKLNLSHPTSQLIQAIQEELPNPIAHFTCEACGRVKRLDYLVNVDAGPSKTEAQGYTICTICVKRGCANHIKYVRRVG